MKTLKKIILTTLCVCCGLLAGIAGAGLHKEAKTASAAVATEYTTVEVPMMMKLENVYVGNGNFNIYVTLPQYDYTQQRDAVQFAGVDLATVFDGFGFFDSVKIGEKTLRELGCTQFYNNQMAFGVGEPKHVVKLYLHADPATWQAAYDNGEVVFGDAQTPVTIGEGTVIPGYNYLNGDANAVVYSADMTYITERVTDLTYSYFTAGQTEIDSVKYVQGHDGNCGYFGVSFVGDDYATDGTQEVFLPAYVNAYAGDLLPNSFIKKVLVNGEAGKVEGYSLLNLGVAGKGYFSFVIRVHEDDVQSVTIPKGSYFPAAVMKTFQSINGHIVYMGYATTEDVTFYKNANGEFVSLTQYIESCKADVSAYRAEKTSAEYFEADLAAMDEAVATALSVLDDTTTAEDASIAVEIVKAFIDSIASKTVVIENAKAELNAYKAGEFREAETAQRAAMIDAGNLAIEEAVSKTGVEMIVANVKGEIDTLKTAAQYADEELASDKAAANATINGYLADVEYLAEQQAERAAAVEAGLAAVASATNADEIAQAVTDAKAVMDALTPKATIVEAAKAELDVYKAGVVYRAEQMEERAMIIAMAKSALDGASSQEAVNGFLASAKVEIDLLKTDIELTEEEKAAADALYGEAKAEALAKINELKAGVWYDDYTAENQAKINELYRLAKKAVADAVTEEAIAQAAVDFETELTALPKIGAEETPNDSALPDDTSDLVEEPKPGNSFGCQSSVGLTGIVGMLAFGVAVLFRNKKED